jgi:hypothetical protein
VVSIPETERSNRPIEKEAFDESARCLGCIYATLSESKSDGRNTLSRSVVSRFRAKLELRLEQVEKNWACGLDDALVVS